MAVRPNQQLPERRQGASRHDIGFRRRCLFDAGNDDPDARWNTYYRSTNDTGTTWSPEVQLSRFTSGFEYKRSEPRDGYLEPYGDYFELDIDGTGRTHVIWGEAPSYTGPGNVWYSTR